MPHEATFTSCQVRSFFVSFRKRKDFALDSFDCGSVLQMKPDFASEFTHLLSEERIVWVEKVRKTYFANLYGRTLLFGFQGSLYPGLWISWRLLLRWSSVIFFYRRLWLGSQTIWSLLSQLKFIHFFRKAYTARLWTLWRLLSRLRFIHLLSETLIAWIANTSGKWYESYWYEQVSLFCFEEEFYPGLPS